MADPQQNYRDVLSRLEAKDKKGTSAQDLYDAASFLPGTGEAIAAYELPGILSQGGQMMQSDDVLEALKGMGLVTLGTAATLPIVGPAAKVAKKGLEGFIPYMGPKLATEGPDSSVMAMTDFEPPKGGTKAADDIDLGSGSLAFGKIDTPVYHFSMEPGFSKFDLDKLPFSDLGPHVGSTPKAAADRFFTKNYGIMPDLNKRYEGKTTDEILKDIQESGIKPDNPDFLGGSVPLKADLSKPFLNPATKKPFTETELTLYKANQLGRLSNNKFTRDDLYFENPNVTDDDIRQAMRKLSRELAEKGFTHIPYVNDFEDVKELSYVMLLDRPKGSTKVLQSPAAVKDPKKFEDADFMMEEGGVVSMKDKAVNMTRKSQGIEPFIKFVV